MEFKECEMRNLREKCHQLEIRLNESSRDGDQRSPVYSTKVKKVMERSPRAKSSFPTEESFMSQRETESVAVPFASTSTKDTGKDGVLKQIVYSMVRLLLCIVGSWLTSNRRYGAEPEVRNHSSGQGKAVYLVYC